MRTVFRFVALTALAWLPALGRGQDSAPATDSAQLTTPGESGKQRRSQCKLQGKPSPFHYTGLGRAPEGAVEVDGQRYLLGLHEHPDHPDQVVLLPWSGPPVIWLKQPMLPAEIETLRNGSSLTHAAKPLTKRNDVAWVGAGRFLVAGTTGVAKGSLVLAQWEIPGTAVASRDFSTSVVVPVKVVRPWTVGKIVHGPYVAWNGHLVGVVWSESTGKVKRMFGAVYDPLGGKATAPVQLGPEITDATAEADIAWASERGFDVIWSAGYHRDYSPLLMRASLSNDGAVGEIREVPSPTGICAYASCEGRQISACRGLDSKIQVAEHLVDGTSSKLADFGAVSMPRGLVVACSGASPLVAWTDYATGKREATVHLVAETKKGTLADVVVSRARIPETPKDGSPEPMEYPMLIPEETGFDLIWSQGTRQQHGFSKSYKVLSQAVACTDATAHAATTPAIATRRHGDIH